MKKFAVQVIALLLVTTGAIYFYNPTGGLKGIDLPFAPQKAMYKNLKINGKTIKVEIADTKEKRSKGLGGRESLEDDSGMLFIFPDSKKHSFWMKGLKFSLDFVWIKDNKVVDIILNAPPPTEGQKDEDLPIFMPNMEVDKILELKSGGVERFGIKVGDEFSLRDIPK